MAELKTNPTGAGVEEFLKLVPEPAQSDCRELVAIMSEATGAQPLMWGSGIVGFGSMRYRYASGRQGDWFRVGFSPRSRNLTLYLSDGVERHTELLSRLGKHTTGKGCVYVKRLADLDRGVLAELISDAAQAHHPEGHAPG